jgi:hypothetical protein
VQLWLVAVLVATQSDSFIATVTVGRATTGPRCSTNPNPNYNRELVGGEDLKRRWWEESTLAPEESKALPWGEEAALVQEEREALGKSRSRERWNITRE